MKKMLYSAAIFTALSTACFLNASRPGSPLSPRFDMSEAPQAQDIVDPKARKAALEIFNAGISREAQIERLKEVLKLNKYLDYGQNASNGNKTPPSTPQE